MTWPFFTVEEMQCRCACKQCDMDEHFMKLLSQVRDAYSQPMSVTSGYRCPPHNQFISPATNTTGPHTLGRAVDIAVYGSDALVLVAVAHHQGMTGIGIQQHGEYHSRFIHLDNLWGGKRPWMWSYA